MPGCPNGISMQDCRLIIACYTTVSACVRMPVQPRSGLPPVLSPAAACLPACLQGFAWGKDEGLEEFELDEVAATFGPHTGMYLLAFLFVAMQNDSIGKDKVMSFLKKHHKKQMKKKGSSESFVCLVSGSAQPRPTAWQLLN